MGGDQAVTVHFVGAGPGAPDLLTLRGRDVIASSPVCLYAGALVPPEILAHAPADARVVDTQDLTLDEIVAECEAAHARGQDVARLHSGRPLDLQRRGRADAPPRRARHPVGRHPGRPRLRRRRRRVCAAS